MGLAFEDGEYVMGITLYLISGDNSLIRIWGINERLYYMYVRECIYGDICY